MFHRAVQDTALLFQPEAYGNPAFNDALLDPREGGYPERADYLGMGSLTFLLGSLLWRPRPGYRRFFLLAAVIALGIILRVPGLGLAYQLPILRLCNLNRFRSVFTFSAAIAFGLTVSEWFGAARPEKFPRLLWLLALALALLSGGLAFHTAPRLLPHLAGMGPPARWLRWMKLWAPPVLALVLAGGLFWQSRRPSGRFFLATLLARLGRAGHGLFLPALAPVHARRRHPSRHSPRDANSPRDGAFQSLHRPHRDAVREPRHLLRPL